jgi:hypothetical protein
MIFIGGGFCWGSLSSKSRLLLTALSLILDIVLNMRTLILLPYVYFII